MKNGKKVYFYGRFSTENQDVRSQREIVYRYCEANGITIDVEVSESASGAKDYRTRNIMQILNRVDEGSYLIVSELSRLSRSMRDFSSILHEYFVPRKINLIIANTGMEIETGNMNTMTEFMLSVFSMASQLELELCKSRIQGAIDARKALWDSLKDGELYYSKGREKPYIKGVDKSPFEHVNRGPKVHYRKRQGSKEDVQTVNEMIRRMWKAGDSLKDISEELNRLQMPTLRGGRWWPTSVKRVLENN